MTIYEALTFAIAFATLMVLVTTKRNSRPCAQVCGYLKKAKNIGLTVFRLDSLWAGVLAHVSPFSILYPLAQEYASIQGIDLFFLMKDIEKQRKFFHKSSLDPFSYDSFLYKKAFGIQSVYIKIQSRQVRHFQECNILSLLKVPQLPDFTQLLLLYRQYSFNIEKLLFIEFV